MSKAYSVEDLLDFLEHASDKGLLPPATATALAVASRNILGVLSEEERKNLDGLDLDGAIRRFQNKRARDFTGPTLKEYGRRLHRAVNMFLEWREDPANFRPPTRATSAGRKRKNNADTEDEQEVSDRPSGLVSQLAPGTYQTSVPLGLDRIVTLVNVPADLTKAEAKRLSAFIEMLAIEQSGGG